MELDLIRGAYANYSRIVVQIMSMVGGEASVQRYSELASLAFVPLRDEVLDNVRENDHRLTGYLAGVSLYPADGADALSLMQAARATRGLAHAACHGWLKVTTSSRYVNHVNRRNVLRLALGASVTGLVASGGCAKKRAAGSRTGPFAVRLGDTVQPTNPMVAAERYFADPVSTLTQGRYRIDLAPGGVLGDDNRVNEI